MKKITFILISILLLVLLTSCGENLAPQTTRLDELKLQYDPIGVGHNKALEEIHQLYRAQRNAQNDLLSYSRCIEIAEEHYNFVNVRNKYIARELSSLISNKRQFAKSSVNAEVIDILSDSLEIIAKYPQIFDSISVILDAPTGIETKTQNLENIYLYADDIIENTEDKEAVMNGISTMIHSVAYWDKNMDDWQRTLTGSMSKPTIGIIGAIGIIDGAGAVIGTLEGIRDTYKGQDGRGRIIVGRAIGEAAKTSSYAFLAIIML
ncbi:MAG: hypothetical protein U9Q91_05925 [Candidatus Marinimicrobia bacterium]|nr:hypothetical protein [Candidatus Neomarinimicrobiota bacterium]